MHGNVNSGFAALTAVRLQYLGLGYNITPNRGKPPVADEWNTAQYLERELRDTPKHTAIDRVRRWEFLYAHAVSTQCPARSALAAIDGDILDAGLAAQFKVKLAEIVPDIVAKAPLRTSVDPKFAYFVCMVDEGPENDFVRIASAKYVTVVRDAYQAAVAAAVAEATANGTAPVPVPPPKSHGIEIWGGAFNKDGNCSRQFGVDGVHKFDDAGVRPASWYGWADDRPALYEVGLEDLPKLTRAQAQAIVDAFREIAEAVGWVALEEPDEQLDRVGDDVFDIDVNTVRFDVFHGPGGIGYADLEDLVIDGSDVRLSPNFITGEASPRSTAVWRRGRRVSAAAWW